MGQITIEKDLNGIEGLCVITPSVHDDGRGYFMETYYQQDMEEAGFNITFVQDNQSMSTKGVLRGLHFQKQFLIPRGFAHGFLVLSDIAEFCYKCDDFYRPNDEGGMAWNDPKIGIVWPKLEGSYKGTASCEGYTADGVGLKLSEKDQKWMGLKNING